MGKECCVQPPLSAARPRGVRATICLPHGVPLPPSTWTRSSASASSQIVRRGQLERHASIVSAYERGVRSSHERKSRVRVLRTTEVVSDASIQPNLATPRNPTIRPEPPNRRSRGGIAPHPAARLL